MALQAAILTDAAEAFVLCAREDPAMVPRVRTRRSIHNDALPTTLSIQLSWRGPKPACSISRPLPPTDTAIVVEGEAMRPMAVHGEAAAGREPSMSDSHCVADGVGGLRGIPKGATPQRSSSIRHTLLPAPLTGHMEAVGETVHLLITIHSWPARREQRRHTTGTTAARAADHMHSCTAVGVEGLHTQRGGAARCTCAHTLATPLL